MKQKYKVLILRILGALFVCTSLILAVVETNNTAIIGGSGMYTFTYVFHRGAGRLYFTMTFLGVIAIVASFIMKSQNKILKECSILASPILLFPVLSGPYMAVNNKYIVEWFGCGCPKFDKLGNVIENDFNANDFTAIFWLFITVIITGISIFLSKRIPKNKIWLKLLYIAGMLALSLLIARKFYYSMMWN